MAAAAQLALPFNEQEHFLYHDSHRNGYVAVLGRDAGGPLKQTTFHLRDMPIELAAHAGQADRWISQGEFFKKNRRVVNLSRMPVAYADLDTYKCPRLATLAPEAVVELLLRACDDRQVPEPSIVVDSGRGLQVKWLFPTPVPQSALPRWTAVQRQLNAALKDFMADASALDASRVLRLEGSVSSRSGRTVRVLHYCRTPALGGEMLTNGVVGYEFGEFADTVLPLSREELEEKRAARAAVRASLVVIEGSRSKADTARSSSRAIVPSELAWDRLADLRTLARLRGFEAGLPSGQRNNFVFLGAVFLAQACLVRNLPAEIIALASEFAPTWSAAEVKSCISSVLSKAEAAARGEVVEYGGVLRSPLYRYSNERLVEELKISGEEGRQLKTILPKDESLRRGAKRSLCRRRADGSVSRDEYLDQVDEKRHWVHALAAQGLSQSAIARETGIPRSSVQRYLSEA